jgi:hypothetical protein
MEIRNREEQKPFTTKDGSTIRSLLDLTNSPVKEQSLAEATLAGRWVDGAALPQAERGALLPIRRTGRDGNRWPDARGRAGRCDFDSGGSLA